jgi:hypothetical protein
MGHPVRQGTKSRSEVFRVVADFTFSQQLILNVVGSLTTALVGAAIIGGLAGLITRRAQDRRAANNLRNELITGMTQAAGTLYMANANYWRLDKSNPNLAEAKEELDKQYAATRVEGAVLEQRLRAYFDRGRTSETDATRPAVIWHSTIDLLTVLYFDATGHITYDIYRDNSKDFNEKFHSGLSIEELSEKWRVLRAYEERLGQATHLVLTSRIQRLGRMLR